MNRRRVVCAVATGVLGAGVVAAPANGGSAAATCTYTPSTGELAVAGPAALELERSGDAITVTHTNAGMYEGPVPVVCVDLEDPGSAAEPTVQNVETVVVTAAGTLSITLFGGPFGPGAQPEAGPDEIEFEVRAGAAGQGTSVSGVGGRVELGEPASGGPEINLNAADEGPGESDGEILFAGDGPSTVSISAAQDATLTGRGGGHLIRPYGARLSLTGGPGEDVLIAGDGPAMLGTTGAADTAIGGPADDFIGSCGDAHELHGGPGNDVISSGGEGLVVDGGDGTDLAFFGCLGLGLPGGRGVSVDLSRVDEQPLGIGGATAAITGIENLDGTPGNDRLRGDAGPNEINGQQGRDRIRGQGGDDVLEGWHNKDRIWGGAGRDVLEGQGEIDRLYARDGTRDLRIDCGQGINGRERARHDRNDPRPRSC